MAQEQRFSKRIPEDDNRERQVCDDCGFIHYVNPKIVVGAVVTWEDKFLLCKRAIEPRTGFWTLPAGYMEENETAEAGAAREAMEEATAEIAIDGLLGIYALSHISQVQLIYRAKLVTPEIAPGPESTEVGLFTWDQIPWDNLAFPSNHWSLNYYREVGEAEVFIPCTGPEGRNPPPGDHFPGMRRQSA